MSGSEEIKKLISMTGERARLDAKMNKSYIVYIDDSGRTVKEHYDGAKEYLEDKNEENV